MNLNLQKSRDLDSGVIEQRDSSAYLAAALAEARGEEAAAAGEGRLAAYTKAAVRGARVFKRACPAVKMRMATLMIFL